MRNDYLRFYVMYKNEFIRGKRHHMHRVLDNTNRAIKEQATYIYHSVLSKYYDGQILYYSLSDEDRELIDHIINMHF